MNDILVGLANNNYVLANRFSCEYCPVSKSCTVKKEKIIKLNNGDKAIYYFPKDRNTCTGEMMIKFYAETGNTRRD